jgi:hypothetical protein
MFGARARARACVCVSATLIGVSQLFQKYYPGNMTEENVKKFKMLCEGDINMAGKAEIEL